MDIARYAFRLEINNELAGVLDHYQLLYYTRRDGKDEIEIIDPKHKRKFLSRTHYPGLKLADILVGGKITIYSRQYRVADFEDDFTRKELGKSKQPCIAVLADAAALGQLWTIFERAGLRALRARLMVLSATEAASISSGCDQPVSAGAAVAFELQGEDPAVTLQRLRTHLEGEGGLSRGSLAVSSAEHEGRLRDAFFAEDPSHRLEAAKEPTVRLEECSCVVILPTAVAKGMAGQILSDLLDAIAKPAPAVSGPSGSAAGPSAAGHTFSGGSGRSADAAGAPLQVSALSMVDLNRRCAEEFLDVYKLVVPDFGELAAEFSSGPCLALEVCGPNAVQRLRELVGPRDIDVAKRVRPHTLRAKYGLSSASPAIHCTDLAEDGPLEAEYLFVLLDQ